MRSDNHLENMIIKNNFTKIQIEKDDLTIRRITESDRDSFSDYTSIEHFQEAQNSSDTLGIFIQKEMVGAIVSYCDVKNRKILSEEGKGTALGYSCRKDKRNQGIMSASISLLSDHLLEELDHVYLEIKRDNLPSIHVAYNAGFEKYDEDEEMLYFIRRRTKAA